MYKTTISYHNNIRRKFNETVLDKIGHSIEEELFVEVEKNLKKLEETYNFEQERETEIDRITLKLRGIV